MSLLFGTGIETRFLSILASSGGMPLANIYERLGFKDPTLFKLLVRRLAKTSLITSDSGFEDMTMANRPMKVQFDVTQNCNLKCKHCYDPRAEMGRQKEDLATVLNVVDHILDISRLTNSKLDLALSGGEPFCSPFLWDILSKLNDHRNLIDRLQILSNGTLINEETIARLQQTRLVRGIQISLDGLTEETHDDLRGRGVFNKALQAMGLVGSSRLILAMHFVVHRKNLSEAYHVIDFAHAHHVNRLTVTRLVPEGNGSGMSDAMLTPLETRDLFTSLAQEFNSRDRGGRFKLAIDRCDWPLIFTEGERCTPAYNGFHCQVGRLTLNIRENGDVYPCRRLPIKIGNLMQDDIHDIMNHELLWQMRRKNTLGLMKGKCSECEFSRDPGKNHMCSGGAACIAYGVYGDPFMPDPQCSVK